MELERLQDLGLNLNEARVYLTLLSIGQGQAGKISKEAQINRTTTYDSLERLAERGLVTFVIEANKKVFRPIAPDRLLSQIKEKERIAKNILPELNELFNKSKSDDESNIFRGRKGINSILQDILNYKEYVAFGSSGRFLDLMKHDFEMFQKQKKEKKIRARAIVSLNAKKKKQVTMAYTTFRYIKNEFASPTTTFIYGNKVAIMIWSETPIATLISSTQVAKSYKAYFELLWGVATRS